MDATGMDDSLTRNQKKEGSAVTDAMRYGVKPVAVRSENLLTSIKASNGNTFSGDGSTQIIFDVPAMAGGYYLDTSNCRMTFNFSLTDANGTQSTLTEGSIGLDRGPNSLINRMQIYDASGHLLEDLQSYHLLYALTELCTNDADTRMHRGAFYKECRFHQNDRPAYDQGGILFSVGANRTTVDTPLMATVTSNFQLSLNFCSAIFGGGATKYYPLSAMNGFRLVLTLNTPAVGLSSFHVVGHNITHVAYRIQDPTLHTNMIRVDPSVDRGLIASSRGKDGRIRIPTQSWRTYSTPISADDTSFNKVIPISVSSLKALFFVFTNPTPNFWQSASGFYDRHIQQYQLFVGSTAIPTTPVQCNTSFAEPITELFRAWHVRMQDAHWGGLITPDRVLEEYTHNGTHTDVSNMVFGVELESMSNKNNVIESGANVLNNNVEIRGTFNQAAQVNMTMVFFALHDVFIVIDPDTGITSLEF